MKNDNIKCKNTPPNVIPHAMRYPVKLNLIQGQVWNDKISRFIIQSLFFIIFFSAEPYFATAQTLLNVPFTSQAPFGVWTQPYQDFCEEASVAMAAHWVWGFSLTTAFADTEMKIIKQFEQLVFGRSKDNSAEEIAIVLKTLYGLRSVSIKEAVSTQELIAELNAGKILIVPAAGSMLKNPYFTPPGPLYHMLVIKGYDAGAREFIANDPGTRRGNGIRYRAETLFNALHDWNNGDVLHGKKMVIVVGK